MRTSTKVAIILFCGLLLLVGSLVNAYGVDYFANTIWRSELGFEETPMVCLIGPPDKYNALRAAKSWELALREHTQSNDYDYKIMVLKEIGPEPCDIFIEFGDPQDVWPSTETRLGAMDCNDYLNKRFCLAVIDPDANLWYNALVHELGHSFGLGHRLSDTKDGFAYLVVQDDIMFAQAKKFAHITLESLDALQYSYNYNGWNGAIIANYTIPHD